MKAKKQETRKSRRASARAASAIAETPRAAYWPYLLGCVLALVVAFEVYGPSLYGPFLFDDQYLPFSVPNFAVDSLRVWIRGVRPLLMFSYWVNYQLSEFQTTSYHAFNVIFHTANSILVFFIVRKVLEFAEVERKRRDVLAAFAGALFLLHPVNSESVGYVASRSENLSILFFYGAFTLYLYRRAAEITWLRVAAVLILFGAAITTKEHTVVLPLLLLLTDYFWNLPFSLAGIRRNWRLYVPITAGGIVAALYLAPTVRRSSSAGFNIKDFTWQQYFFTQCRALWLYVRLFLFPAGLNIDRDFPISRTIVDHGAIVGLAALLLAAGAAFYFRRRYPLAAYGVFAFLILMAPTSSFVPIADPVAERRLYLSMIGLLFIVMEFLRCVDVRQHKWMMALAAVLLIAAGLTHNRNYVWGDKVALWEDTVAKSPNKARVQFQLAQAYYETHDCAKALPHYARSAELDPMDDRVFTDWGLDYDCLNDLDQAVAKIRHALSLKPTAHGYSQLGMIFGKNGKYAEALEALGAAAKIDPSYDMTYVYRGDVHLSAGDPAAAVQDFRQALALNPKNQPAMHDLEIAESRLGNRR